MTKDEFTKLTSAGPVLLDGATGSNLRAAGMPVGVSAEQWVLDHPAVITALQRDYARAGSQIVYAPTFCANRVGLGAFGLEDRLWEMNTALVKLSREAVEGRALVAGDLTTTGLALEPAGTMTYSGLYEIYREQVQALAEAGADLLVVETMLTLEETSAALDAAQSVCGLPVMCSFTVEADGSLLYGGSVVEAALALQEMGASAVGVNCSLGPDQLVSVIAALREAVDIPVLAKPNAGLPAMDDRGQAHYSMDAPAFARHMKALAGAGAALLGGCCGTTPDYIQKLSEALQ